MYPKDDARYRLTTSDDETRPIRTYPVSCDRRATFAGGGADTSECLALCFSKQLDAFHRGVAVFAIKPRNHVVDEHRMIKRHFEIETRVPNYLTAPFETALARSAKQHTRAKRPRSDRSGVIIL